ncbi:MAG: hypothetical protein IPN86_23970 [Saprospiraceae bacterium]|nr:hypothetical protein [Saprospiraceae bacterium]
MKTISYLSIWVIPDGTQLVQKAVFPFAIITRRQKIYINLLERKQKPGDDEDIILNKSVALLEYKFANAFQKMQSNRSKNVLFTQGRRVGRKSDF